ncbi:MAG: hypothetical protein ACYDC5_12195 [Candidatus Dormibacteria bacterium]
MERDLTSLERSGRDLLEGAGVRSQDVVFERSADLRWMGQSHSVTVTLQPGPYTSASLPAIVGALDSTCERVYGVALAHTTPELLTWRVTASGPAPISALPTPAPRDRMSLRRRRRVYFPSHGWVNTPIYARDSLELGFKGRGPAIVQEADSACLVHPGDGFEVDQFLNLVVTVMVGERSSQ